MIPFRRILAPVALSPACAWAARYATGLATKFDAELTFLHVTDGADRELRSFLAAQIPGAVYQAVVVSGDPADQIVAVAQQRRCDSIVMPTHAYGRFRRFLLGSVTAKVLHDAMCPVWTGVHHADAPSADDGVIRSIVCAVDLDPSCVGVIRSADELSSYFHAKLQVVHAVPAADETSDNRGEIELRRYLFRRAQNEFAALCDAANLKIPVALAGGPTARVVREAALREHADLVVIGRGHTRCGFRRLGTAAYSIIRDSPCPVLSVGDL